MRVTQYNALAQCYVRSAQFPHSPSSALKCVRALPPPGADHDRALAIVHPRARAPDARPPPRPTPPSPPRRWKARSKALADELASIDADVLALQELDQYDDFWRPKLEAMGYAGWFCKRTERTAPKKDGCGLFYKRDAFELIARRDVQFNDLAVSHLGPGERARRAREAAEAQTLRATGARAGNDGTRRPSEEPSETLDPLRNAAATPSDSDSESVPPPEDARFVRDCVATMALLVAKEKETGGDEKRKGRPVLVASAHLFWDPAHADVKLAQAERLLAEAADFLRAEAEAEGGRLSGRASDDESALASSSAPRARLVADSTPIVLAGDFNSVPGSDVHARALRGVLLPRAEAENAEGYEGAEARDRSLRDRSLRYRSLRSAYADAMASGSVSSAGLKPGETAVGFREGGSPGGEGSDPRGSGSPLEPAHTTVTPGFTDCIDYVFVSEDVEVLGAEAIPGAGGALAAGLPNANRPSDHLPVTVRLAF